MSDDPTAVERLRGPVARQLRLVENLGEITEGQQEATRHIRGLVEVLANSIEHMDQLDQEIVTDGGVPSSNGVEHQTALTSHAGREIAEPVRDDERNVRCPDCDQIVSASKGSHPAPDDAPTERIWGWQCSVCENTLPSNALQEDAPTFNDRITAVEVTFRDGSERLVPAPKTHVEGGESA